MNRSSEYDFTIVVPVYNEADNMSHLEEALGGYLSAASVKTCVLFVDDGSTDDSLAGIKRICERVKHCYYLSFERNAGLSAAIKAGIDRTCSHLVGYIDADLQTSPEDFEILLPYALGGEYALVTGIRADRKDTGFKRFQSRLANGFRRMMTGDGATDTGCPLKILRTDVAQRIPFFRGMHRFLPALVRLQEGCDYKEIAVRHFPRRAGESKFHLWNRLVAPLVDCFAYRWMKRRYINYRIADDNL